MAEDLGRDIVEGRILPGEPIPAESILLSRFGVSRTVAREALQILTAKGMLQARQRRGTIVRPRAQWSQLDATLLGWHAQLSANHPALLQLMEVRRIVEPPAAALAARRGTEAEHARIAAAYEDMARAGEDVDTFLQADLEFHTAILEASGNQFLLPIAQAIRSTLPASLRLTNSRGAENRQISLPLHAAILEAILRRDAPAADAAMRTHLDDTERRRFRAAGQPGGDGDAAGGPEAERG